MYFIDYTVILTGTLVCILHLMPLCSKQVTSDTCSLLNVSKCLELIGLDVRVRNGNYCTDINLHIILGTTHTHK